MPTRATLESARQRLCRLLARFQDSLADRAILDPVPEARQRYAERRAAELGLAAKAEKVRRSG